MPSVPPELCDYIVDFLHDDPPSLAACSLTCHEWKHTARYHLFSSVILCDLKFCTAFAKLLTSSPTLGRYVRELHISRLATNTPRDAQLAARTLSSVLVHLDRICTLGVSLLDLSILFKGGLMTRATVRALHLQYCTFPSFEDLAHFMCAFPHLADLTLNGVSWASGSLGVRPRPGLASPLRTLVLGRDLPLDALVEHFICGASYDEIRSLSATCTSEGDASAVGALVDSLGSKLEHLELEWCPSRFGVNAVFLPRALSLQECHNLKTLSLRCVISEDCSIPWVTNLLADLPTTSIREITVDIRLLGDLDALDWAVLEKILSEAKFQQLQSLVFKVAVWSGVHCTPREVMQWIRERLPSMNTKGIVHFQPRT